MSQQEGQPQSQERRRFTRIAFDAEAELRLGDQRWIVEITDISLKGVLLSHPAGFEADAGAELIVECWLDSDVQLVLPVVLKRIDANYLGCACGPIDLDSITHLRRLVELNLGDDSLLERELDHLIEAQ
ncbi:PilZ domain-containing protein [Motiliproteus coralliicola]|uniref:Cyclic diguanosine monophosphate-binding protein n=1 Tax=Motiliproteus coralliicola TaxID=2283196 RepID=A0A369WCG1_9GAMM|nr:PilZ domain-containing protein [Motiliproteus coralliicola]RDE18869.1 PilZ domain-containing protein [Motiliproteus coralliicola]